MENLENATVANCKVNPEAKPDPKGAAAADALNDATPKA